jgi:hypothetical protein
VSIESVGATNLRSAFARGCHPALRARESIITTIDQLSENSFRMQNAGVAQLVRIG